MTKILVDKAVIEQALEALKYERDANNPLDWHHDKTMTALCAALEQPQPESDDWQEGYDAGWKAGFCSPAQPPRQPLTDEAVLGVAKSIEIQFDGERLNEQIDDILTFARAIERAHGIGGEA